MTEFSWYWTTSAAPVGDQQTNAAGYTQAMVADAQTLVAACGAGGEGVAPGGPGYLTTLLNGTVPAANTCRIAPGGAINDGHFYKNTANVDVNIPSSAGGTTRIDRVVLRCIWASFTVRIFRIAGVDNVAPSVPAITQTPGATYDIKLFQCLVNSAGTVVLTDERVSAGLIANRQGGSVTDWSTPGTTNYKELLSILQSGVIQVAIGGGVLFGSTGVTFPNTFSLPPSIVLGLVYSTGAIAGDVVVPEAMTITLTGFQCYARRNSADAAITVNIHWLAIGQP